MKKPKIIYREKYRSGSLVISSEERLPRLKHLVPGFRATKCEILAAGKFDDGREFQDLRVTIEEIT